MKNTKKNSVLRFMIFKEKTDIVYTGICVDLAIVKEHKDIIQLRKDLENSAKGYLEVINKNKLSDNFLNQEQNLPDKYLQLYEYANKMWEQKKLTKPKEKVRKIIETNFFFKPIPSFSPSY